jgi:hypothetical protein
MAGIHQPADIRMREIRQDLPLLQEASTRPSGVKTRAQHLDCHLLAHLAICALGQVHQAHPARSDQAQQTVRTAQALIMRYGSMEGQTDRALNDFVQIGMIGCVKRQQGIDFAAYFSGHRMLLEVNGTLLLGQVRQSVKQCRDFGLHVEYGQRKWTVEIVPL